METEVLEEEINESNFQFKALKPLPRDSDGEISRYFWANGNKYKICGVEEILSAWRYTEFERMSIVAGMSLNFDALFVQLTDLEGKIHRVSEDPITRTPAILQISAIKNGVIKESEMRWTQTAFFSTLFIVRENEDLTKWCNSEIRKKIHGIKGNRDDDEIARVIVGEYRIEADGSLTNVIEASKDAMQKSIFYIVENSNYSAEYLEKICVFDLFKILNLVEEKIIKKNEIIKAQNESQ
jgi:hypothetical protein